MLEISGKLLREKFEAEADNSNNNNYDNNDDNKINNTGANPTKSDVVNNNDVNDYNVVEDRRRRLKLKYRLRQLRDETRLQIVTTVESVEADVLKSNVHNIILAMSNLLGGNIKRSH